MGECKYYGICGREALAGDEKCILHSEDSEKSPAEFKRALQEYQQTNGDSFTFFVFPSVQSFCSSKFSYGANFVGAKFTKGADFSYCKFNEEVNFSSTHFAGEANFKDAQFGEESDVRHPEGRAQINFTGAQFEGNAIFFQARFEKLAQFYAAHFSRGVDFRRSKFSEGATFRHAWFVGRARFDSSTDRKGNPDQVFSGGVVDFRDVIIDQPEALAFRDADLENCTFLGTDLRKAEFANVKWPRIPSKKLPRFVSARCPSAGSRIGVYDETLATENGQTDDYPHIEQLYRQLKQNYEDRREYVTAGDFHYGEKEMRRLNPKTSRGLRSLLWLYWVVSGYGERCLWPLGWALLLLVVCAATYGIFGLETPPPNSTAVLVGCSEALRYSLQVMTLLKPNLVPVGEVGKWVHAFESLAGPILIGLFALALRQRLKR